MVLAVKPGSAGLSPQFSLFLDLARVLAACAVVLCHFGAQRMSGGALWFLNPYGAQAVDVFFVLSGYLVSAAAQREPSAARFAANRASRIYSVAVPAVALTFLLDAAGRQWAPALYATIPAYAPGHPALALQAASGLLFFNQAWLLTIPVGANVPWWSLGYEVAYYVAFGLFWYGGKWVRVIGPLLVAALAGPTIVALALLWLAGAAVRHGHDRGWPSRNAGRALATAAPLLWGAYEAWVHFHGRPFGVVPWMRPELLQDVLVGGLFAAFLAGVPRVLATRPVAPGAARAIRFLAGRSFALYLLHYPIMLCLHAAMLRWDPSLSPYWLLAGTAGLVLGLAELTERRQALWRDMFTLAGGRVRQARKRFFLEKEAKTFIH